MPRDRDQHLYADPHVYDVLHDEGTRRDARLFWRVACRASPALASRRRPLWLEPACGSGRYLLAWARMGHKALGIDLSAAMVRYARASAAREGLAERLGLVRASMERFGPAQLARAGMAGPFDVACTPINSIRHLGSDRAMLAHLACVRRVLREEGVYLVGISLSAYGLEDPSEDVWHGRRSGVHVTQVVQYIPPEPDARGAWARRERVLSHLTIETRSPRGTLLRSQHRDSRYWLRTYNRAQWEALLAPAGWRVALTTDTDGRPCQPREPGYYLYALTKASSAKGPRTAITRL